MEKYLLHITEKNVSLLIPQYSAYVKTVGGKNDGSKHENIKKNNNIQKIKSHQSSEIPK